MTSESTRPETIGDMLLQRQRDSGTRVAIVADGRQQTYAELVETAFSVAGYLVESGVAQGDRVALLMPPGIAWAAVHYGVILAGAIVVPLNLAWQAEELTYALRQSGAVGVMASSHWRGKALASRVEAIVSRFAEHDATEAVSPTLPILRFGVLFGEYSSNAAGWRNGAQALSHVPTPAARATVLDRLARTQGRSNCCIVYTSGSTGRPKPALLHHFGLLHAAFEYGRSIDLQASDRMLVPWPTFHVSGISAGMMMGHVRSITGWLMEAYDPGQALDLIEAEALTVFSGFDTTFTTMLGHADFSPRRLVSIERLLLATGPALYDRVFKAFPSLRIASKCYAMTETCGPSVLAYPQLVEEAARKYSQGIPVPGAHVRIVDPVSGEALPPGKRGEIRLKGPILFNGYFDMPDATTAAYDSEGWFCTGDLGSLGANRALMFDGRLKRIIKSGGENVSEREVEVFLEDRITGVNIAQVVGTPDPLWGEAVVAFIETTPGTQLTEQLVRDACKNKIADYKIPKRVWLLKEDEWPRNDVGKISKDALAALAAANYKT